MSENIIKNSTLGFSVIVATYNLKNYLEKCLDALSSLDYGNYEIIVIDDGSKDGSREYLKDLSLPNLKVILNESNEGTCKSRNRGIAVAQYPFIAFTDHDCLPDPSWLKQLHKCFITTNADFVFSSVYYVSPSHRGYFPERLVRNPQARWPMGCNLAFKTEAIRKIGGFDPELFPFGNENTEIALRALAAGMKYSRAPEAVVIHQAIDWSPRSLFRSARYASVWPLLKKKYPKTYRHFGGPVRWGLVTNPEDYLYIATLPILIPLLLVRYLWHGKKDLRIFFAKWPAYLFLRRYYVLRESLNRKTLMF